MSDPVHHSMSSARKFGGKWQDYYPLHSWFDETKNSFADARHRAMRHHAEGIAMAIEKFGPAFTVEVNGKPRDIPTRLLAEQHVIEDMGFIPTMAWWLQHMQLVPAMVNKAMARPDQGKLRARDRRFSYDPFNPAD